MRRERREPPTSGTFGTVSTPSLPGSIVLSEEDDYSEGTLEGYLIVIG